MVTDRDITVRAVANSKDISALTARDVMTNGIVWCRDNDDVTHVANVMQSKQICRLPVIDKDKRMVGIMSLADLFRMRRRNAQPRPLRRACPRIMIDGS